MRPGRLAPRRAGRGGVVRGRRPFNRSFGPVQGVLSGAFAHLPAPPPLQGLVPPRLRRRACKRSRKRDRPGGGPGGHPRPHRRPSCSAPRPMPHGPDAAEGHATRSSPSPGGTTSNDVRRRHARRPGRWPEAHRRGTVPRYALSIPIGSTMTSSRSGSTAAASATRTTTRGDQHRAGGGGAVAADLGWGPRWPSPSA